MELFLHDTCSEISVSDKVFGFKFNAPLVHQVVTSYQLGSRQGTSAQKNRSEVSGSGKKPWRQKGTGRARSGSIRSPIWRSGGVTFAAKTQCYRKKINKKMYRGALKSIFSELIRQGRLIIVHSFCIGESRTKILIDKLRRINLNSDVLIIVDTLDKHLFLASRNLYKIQVCHVRNVNPLVLMSFNKVLMTIHAIKNVEDVLI